MAGSAVCFMKDGINGLLEVLDGALLGAGT
jgi:hypothetical protein